MSMTAAEFIKAKVPFRAKKILVPGGLGEMWVKEMTPNEIDKLHEETQAMSEDESDTNGQKNSLKRQRHCFAHVIATAVYDPKTQKPLFNKKEAAQIVEKPMGYLLELKRIVEYATLGIGAEEIDDPNA